MLRFSVLFERENEVWGDDGVWVGSTGMIHLFHNHSPISNEKHYSASL